MRDLFVPVDLSVEGPDIDLEVYILIHDAFDFRKEGLGILVADASAHVHRDSDVDSDVFLHTWKHRATVGALAIEALERVVIAHDALDLLLDQLPPVHLRLGKIFDQALDASGHTTCACGRGTLDHSLLDLVTDLLGLFFGDRRLAFAVAFLVAGAGTLFFFEMLV